jgi:basic amino acid/polyamine antiporter, APA family
MAEPDPDHGRTIGLFGATGIGVGAIVGGGVLVLAGIAYARTGPGVIVAFALDGLIAFVTALSVAEISTAFPESGGTYTFAKKVLSVRAAFGVGWVVWFAYIVAGVLYALGFASYAALALHTIWHGLGGSPPAWLGGRRMALLLATAAVAIYAIGLIRKSGGGGMWETVGKVIVFAFLIVAGLVAMLGRSVGDLGDALDPFFSGGAGGLVAAMGFTFIALQGFEIIAAVAGEVKQPQRTVPRAMFLSLGAALAIYLPLLLVVGVVGVEPGGHITDLARQQPETVIAVAVENYLGVAGFWLVIVAAVLSTLSALHANLLAASRIAHSMARDRTLPTVLAGLHKQRGTPVMAIYATSLTMVAILFMVPNLAGAGAAASLIFLVSFALTHLTTFLARVRGGARPGGFRTPWFPAIPIGGGVACVGLALYQAVAEPDAGGIVVIWLGLGVILYLSLFSQRAEITDASAEALDPSLMQLRGRNPLVLLPIANPAHATGMIAVANALAPQGAGRVLLLTVVQVSDGAAVDDIAARLADAQSVVGQALGRSYGYGARPEALITAAPDPWLEIRRVAEVHDCESLLLGVGEITDAGEKRIVELMNAVDRDVAVMAARVGWRLEDVERVLVPVAGRGDQHELRARLLGSICRKGEREVVFVRVLPTRATAAEVAEARAETGQMAQLKLRRPPVITVLRSDDPAGALVEAAADCQLVLLGLRSAAFGRKALGHVAVRIAREAPCATIMLARRRYRAHELWQPLRDVVVEPVLRISRPVLWQVPGRSVRAATEHPAPRPDTEPPVPDRPVTDEPKGKLDPDEG